METHLTHNAFQLIGILSDAQTGCGSSGGWLHRQAFTGLHQAERAPLTLRQAVTYLRLRSCSMVLGGREPHTASTSAWAVRCMSSLHARWCMVWLRMGELS